MTTELVRRLDAIFSESADRFDLIVTAAGLEPSRDFRNRDLRGFDLSKSILSGYDFSYCDLRGTNLRYAEKVDATVIFFECKLDEDDRLWLDEHRRTIDFEEQNRNKPGKRTPIFIQIHDQPNVMGDSFLYIQSSTLINRSLLQNAFNKASETGEETAQALRKVASAVAQSGNKEAGEILDQFNEELARAEPRKSLLKRSWESLVQTLPAIAQLAGAAAAIMRLFAD